MRLPPQAMPAAAHPLCGDGKLTVSTISGGVQVNVVPANCRAMVDRRMLPGEDPMAVHAAIARLLERNTAVTVEQPYAAEAGVEFSPSAPIVRAAAAACRQLGRTDLIGVPYSTDAVAYCPARARFRRPGAR